MLQNGPEGEVREVVVDLTDRHAVHPAQRAQVNDVVALLNPQRVRHVAGGRAQDRQQLFAGGVAALIEKVLAKTRLGIKRVVKRTHQHQHADALTTLDPAALHQLIDGTTQGVTIHFVAVGKLLLGRQVVPAAIVRAQLHFELCRNLLPAGGVTGRMSG